MTDRWGIKRVVGLLVVLVAVGAATNWLTVRSEAMPSRAMLSQLPSELGMWKQRGSDQKFDTAIESVLRTDDYVMREYADQDGQPANVYIGYYASQRTGATYHSPQNCLPGAGWVMLDPAVVTLAGESGTPIQANRYIVENDRSRQVMIYWYQGRGRTRSSEYRDKLDLIVDSVLRSRSDGAMVRVMTPVGADEKAAEKAAEDLAARVSDALGPFVPE